MYILITSSGKVMKFTVQACAELYAVCYGGQIIDNQLYDSAAAEIFEAELV
jgi:hypothetical protein